MMFYSPVPPSASSALKGNIQQGSNIPIRNCEAGQIDRSRERRIPEPPQKPSAELKPVKPQRRLHERLEKPLALRRVSLRPLKDPNDTARQPELTCVGRSTGRTLKTSPARLCP